MEALGLNQLEINVYDFTKLCLLVCWWSLTTISNRQFKSKMGEMNILLTHACTINVIPRVLEKTSFAGHTFKYKWKINKTKQNMMSRKNNVDSISRRQAKAHHRTTFGLSTTEGAA
jgi:hypothetical protein